ncbi:hypothetical protein SISNIDRAFT_468227 [Sistotremastrum niveocremeum HHB9708]|uniref:Uncharacterized protein n=1 Tax=Sistotremastrum niveocremeum HHB9708 TaxID=1314777 RepID=A0A164RY67_9AGAM|nr:hypothetical protein SISNIDRAFT_468227 [Sistotremastrum niveocremeum HHB9708]
MPTALFRRTYPELVQGLPGGVQFDPASIGYADHMPNPFRALAGGLQVDAIPVILNEDDMSGNTTTQWNVHYSIYASNAGLPRQEIEKMKHIKFTATSPNASPMEMMEAVCNELREARLHPQKIWDCRRKEYIMVLPWILFVSGDNPMQSEFCSHIGLRGSRFCRICEVGGTMAEMLTDIGFATIFEPQKFREPSDTLQVPQKKKAGRPNLTTDDIHELLLAETARHKGGELFNPLLVFEGLQIHKDTPVEVLHTILLGIIKYFWNHTMVYVDKDKHMQTFQARLNSLDHSGLNIPKIDGDYMIRYKGGLVGKHFKTIVQIMVFIAYDLVPRDVYNAWVTLGSLVVNVWNTDIKDMEQYKIDLTETIARLMDSTAKCAPLILLTKPKFHILSHLPYHIERFGPAMLTSTERYEAFNHIFRLCSTHSNRQAPSRDIALTFAGFERCRYIVTGGYWWDPDLKRHVCASPRVIQFVKNSDVFTRMLGIEYTPPPSPFTLTFPPKHRITRERPPSIPFATTLASSDVKYDMI